MNRPGKIIVASLLLAGACVLVAAGPWNGSPTARADEDSVLEQSMETLNGGFRTMRRMVRGEIDHAKLLEIAPGMQTSAIAAKGEMPHTIEELSSAEEKTEQRKEFRLGMIALATELLNLEKAALSKDDEAVKASVEKLGAIQKQGHDKFKKQD